MKNPCIYLSKNDFKILTMLLHGLPSDNNTVKHLNEELKRAVVLESVDDVGAIGINDVVRLLDMGTGTEEIYIPVLPANADPENHKISVLVPMGAGLLGFCTDDEFEWPTPGGIRRLKILNVRKAGQAKAISCD